MADRYVIRNRTVLDPLSPAAQPKYIVQPTYVLEDDGVRPDAATEQPAAEKPPVRKVPETTRLVYAAFAGGLAPFEPADPGKTTANRLIGER